MNEAYTEGEAGPLLPGGVAPVKSDSGTLLVANAVPGDRLRVRVIDRRRGAVRGEIVEVIQASADRIDPPCPIAKRCGGCVLQAISPVLQAEVKSSWVRNAFAALIDDSTEWSPAENNPECRRRRVRWHVGCDEQGNFLGFYALATHDVVRQHACMVVTPELEQLRVMIESSVDLAGVIAVQAVQLADGMHVIIECKQKPVLDPGFVEDLTLKGDNEAGVQALSLQWWWRDSGGITRPLKKPVVAFYDRLPAGESQVKLAVGPDDFVQGEMAGNRELIARIQQWAGKPRRVADLFCGIGNLSLPLAAATGASVYGAELNAASVRAASANARRLQLDARFVEANLFEKFDMEPYINADLLILDPPRRGARRICASIQQLLPTKIIMISCDSAAGARDGALLQKAGYRLAALKALDLFPGAGHVEAMSLWLRT